MKLISKMNEEKAIMAALPPAPDLSIVGPPPKRKKGRPPKNRALLPGGESSPSPAPPKPDGRGRKPKQKNGDVVWPAVDSAYVGQQVHGVLDGSFDAGYLLTVRVGNTQTVLRGAVFEPSLSIPISESNDIAPHVKFVSRGDLPLPLLPYLTEHASASVAVPSPPIVTPVSSGDNNRASVPSPSVAPPLSCGDNNTAAAPMEEDRRLSLKASSAPLAESLHVSSGVALGNQKDVVATQVASGVATFNQKGMAPPEVPSGVVMYDQKDTAPPHVPSATDDLKGTAPPVQSRDNLVEEKMDMRVDARQP